MENISTSPTHSIEDSPDCLENDILHLPDEILNPFSAMPLIPFMMPPPFSWDVPHAPMAPMIFPENSSSMAYLTSGAPFLGSIPLQQQQFCMAPQNVSPMQHIPSQIQNRPISEISRGSSSSSSSDALSPPTHAVPPKVLLVDWMLVVKAFSKAFQGVYQSSSAKIHLDISGISVDGARDKWKSILLFDCVMAYALNKERTKQECGRRRFNQYMAFSASVCAACADAWLQSSTSGLIIKPSTIVHNTHEIIESPVLSGKIPEFMTIVNIQKPWDSLQNLRAQFLEGTNSTTEKRTKVVKILIDDFPYSGDFVLKDIFEAVVYRIYRQHFQLTTQGLGALGNFSHIAFSEAPLPTVKRFLRLARRLPNYLRIMTKEEALEGAANCSSLQDDGDDLEEQKRMRIS